MKLLDKLEALAAEHEEKARSIRTTMALLSENGHAAALDALPGKLQKAIRREAQGNGWPRGGARPGAGRPKKQGPARLHLDKKAKVRRRNTAKIYATFGDTAKSLAEIVKAVGRPMEAVAPIVGSLFRYGYLKKVDNGYVHSAKAFEAPAD